MDIHRLYSIGFRLGRFRERRMARFRALFSPGPRTRILDVGGAASTWLDLDAPPRVLLVNVDPGHGEVDLPGHVTFHRGDGRRLPYRDGAFDIAFSNSVIEHVGSMEDQRAFAAELCRVARRVWCQTPARAFLLEPHFLTPFVHWLPTWLRRRLIRSFTVWGWVNRPTQGEVDAIVDEIRLLSRRELQALFPDCTIVTERWLGWPKSYVAVRR